MDCYNYIPHFHKERLYQRLPKTPGDQFIWVGSSGDISFCKDEWFELILNRIKWNPNKAFFLQTKNPFWFSKWEFPPNTILGITLETDRNDNYSFISKAPKPSLRVSDFCEINHLHKRVTIEPILDFNLDLLDAYIWLIRPEIVYIGYDTKKNNLPEPSLEKTQQLIKKLEKLTIIKTKFMRGDF